MPNIPEFELSPQQTVLHPSEEGPSAFERIGRTEQFAGQEAGQVLAHGIGIIGKDVAQIGAQFQQATETKQMVDGMKQSTALQIQFAQDQEKALASPDPVQATKDLLNDYSGKLDEIGQSFTTPQGKRYWAEHQATAYSSLAVHGIAAANEQVGQRLVTSVDTTTANLAMIVNQNPAALGDVLKQHDQLVDAAKSGLTAQQQNALEEHRRAQTENLGLTAVDSAATQFFKNNPEAKPEDFPLDKIARDAGGNSVFPGDSILRAQAIVRAAHAQNDHLLRETSSDAIEQYENSIFTQSGRVDPRQAVIAGQQAKMDPKIMPKEKLAVARFAQSAVTSQMYMDNLRDQGIVMKEDPRVAGDLMYRVGRPDNPTTPEQVEVAVQKHAISAGMGWDLMRTLRSQNMETLAKVNSSPVVKAEFDKAARMIAGPNDPTNDAVRAKTDEFKLDTLRYLQGVILGGGDIKPFLDPNAKEYLFGQDKIMQYTPTQKELSDQVVAPPVKPTAPTLTDQQQRDMILKAFGGGL